STTLLLNGAGTLNTTSYNVTGGGVLAIDNSGTNIAGRINSTATVALNGGSLSITGGNGASSVTIPTLALQSGVSTVNLTGGSGGNANALTIGTLQQTAGATVNFTNLDANDTVSFTTSPSLIGGILPYATFGSTDFATVSAGSIADSNPTG